MNIDDNDIDGNADNHDLMASFKDKISALKLKNISQIDQEMKKEIQLCHNHSDCCQQANLDLTVKQKTHQCFNMFDLIISVNLCFYR